MEKKLYKVSLLRCPNDPQADVSTVVRQAVSLLGGMGCFVAPGNRVLVKPNLVDAVEAGSGVVTDPRVVAAVCQMAIEAGASEVIIAESSMVGIDTRRAFRRSGMSDMARRLGLRCVDLKRQRQMAISIPGKVLTEIEVPQWLASYKIINVPLVKTHIQVGLSCAMKNLKGLVSDKTKRRIHHVGLRQGIVDLNSAVAPVLNVVDGLVGMEGTGAVAGDPVPLGLVMAGANPLAVDRVASALAGIEADRITYLQMAAEAGLGPARLSDIEILGEAIEDLKRPFRLPSEAIPLLTGLEVEEKDACSACLYTIARFLRAKEHEVARILRDVETAGKKLRIRTGCHLALEDSRKGDIIFGKCAWEALHHMEPHVPGCPPGESKDLLKAIMRASESIQPPGHGIRWRHLIKRVIDREG
jgi:uncharacterized protein (DUF362 family)